MRVGGGCEEAGWQLGVIDTSATGSWGGSEVDGEDPLLPPSLPLFFSHFLILFLSVSFHLLILSLFPSLSLFLLEEKGGRIIH